MTIQASTPSEYITQTPEVWRNAITRLRDVITTHLPKGFNETIYCNMISYVVPHSKYPAGYHCDPKVPLPFISIACQKNFIAIYHLGIYVDPDLLQWFTAEYPKHSKTKLDMGKSCIRFKNPAHIPYDLIAQLVSKIDPDTWINLYEKKFKTK